MAKSISSANPGVIRDTRFALRLGISVVIVTLLGRIATPQAAGEVGQLPADCANAAVIPDAEFGAMMCMDAVVALNAPIWSALFPPEQPFDWQSCGYELLEDIASPATVAGINSFGEGFWLDAEIVEPLSVQDAVDQGVLTLAEAQTALDAGASCSLVWGDLWTGRGREPVLAAAHSAVRPDGSQVHGLLILARLPDAMAQSLRDMHHRRLLFEQGLSSCWPPPCVGPPCPPPPAPPDCFDVTCCDKRWRDREAEILIEFKDCMKDQAAPLGLKGLLCIAVCSGAGVIGGAPGFLACMHVCLGSVAIGGLVDFGVCESQRSFKSENNLISYCACLQWKQMNCGPAGAEPQVRNCP